MTLVNAFLYLKPFYLEYSHKLSNWLILKLWLRMPAGSPK